MSGRVLVLVHVAGAVLFLGGIAMGLFFAMRARRSRDAHVLAHTFASLNAADTWITTPSVLVLTLTGVVAAMRTGLPLLSTGWIAWSIVAFSLSGLAFVAKVLPLQRSLARAYGEAAGNGTAADGVSAAGSLAKAWGRWAHVSFLCAALALALMVLKPALPGLFR